MQFFRQINKSFSAKVFTYLFAAMVLITASLSIFYLHLQKRYMTNEKMLDGEILTTVLAGNVRLGLFAEDNKRIAESFRVAFGVKDVIGVCAYNAAGQLLYRETRQGWEHTDICIKKNLIGDIFDEGKIPAKVRSIENKKNIEFWSPVQSRPSRFSEESLYFDLGDNSSTLENPYPVGFVGVIYTKAHLHEAIQGMLKKGFLLLFFSMGLVWIATYFIIREVTKPVKRLINSIKNYGINVESKDEVGILADTFSDMIATLEDSIYTVNTLKVDLENKVEDLEGEIRSRRKAEAALRESENKFRSISESIADGVAIVQEGKFVWLNRAFRNILGYNHFKDLFGHKVEEVLNSVQSANNRRPTSIYMEAGPPFQAEVLRQNGSLITLDVKVSQSTFDGYPAIELIIRDVTEKMEIEKERKEMELKALSLSKLATIGEIATGIAHEINQPLTFVKIAYQAALRDLGNGQFQEDEIRQKFSEALRQVERITLITEHLRNFGRKNIAMVSQVNLPKVLDDALILMAERIRLRNMELIRDIDKDLPAVHGNKMQIEQVFINLLQNSTDAIERKKGGKIRVSMRKSGSFLEITFSDTGPGITPDVEKYIFEPFFTTKEEEKGVGLGLAITYNIIKEHNGTIEYRRIKGWGATFVITLPISEE